MVLEVAQIEIKPGRIDEFLRVMTEEGCAHLAACAGCNSVRAMGGVENPDRALVLVEWDSVEAHVSARDSEPFRRFIAAAGPFFGDGGKMEHFRLP